MKTETIAAKINTKTNIAIAPATTSIGSKITVQVTVMKPKTFKNDKMKVHNKINVPNIYISPFYSSPLKAFNTGSSSSSLASIFFPANEALADGESPN